MKQVTWALLLLAAVMVSACGGSGGKTPAESQGQAAAAPVAKTGDKAASSGGTYKGKVQRGFDITFAVSADGRQVTKVAANVLESCSGASTSRTTQLYWDGPFAVKPDGTVVSEGEDPEFKGVQYRFTAKFAADGTAEGTVLQKGGGCTTYELQWTAKKN